MIKKSTKEYYNIRVKNLQTSDESKAIKISVKNRYAGVIKKLGDESNISPKSTKFDKTLKEWKNNNK